MNQYGPEVDKQLNALSREIGVADRDIEEATQRKDEKWEEAKGLLFEVQGNQQSPRFIANDGHYLQLQYREGTPKLNEEMLQAYIFQQMDRREATKIWNQITKRVIDPVALEAAVRTQKVPADIIEQCMTPAKETYARIRKEWTKDDRERARIMGIEVELPA